MARQKPKVRDAPATPKAYIPPARPPAPKDENFYAEGTRFAMPDKTRTKKTVNYGRVD